MILTIREIVKLCEFAGITIDHDKSVMAAEPEQFDTQVTVFSSQGKNYACLTEYPDEGSYQLSEDEEVEEVQKCEECGIELMQFPDGEMVCGNIRCKLYAPLTYTTRDLETIGEQ